MNFYKRYMGDYGRDTAHLSLAEHGAYALLLDHYYSTEAALPAELLALYRLCRAFDKSEQKAVESVANMYFPVGEDGLRHNARADREIPKDQRNIETARVNGKHGGRPISKTTAKPTAEPTAEPIAKPQQNPAGIDNGTQAKPAAKTHQTSDLEQEQEQEQRSKSLGQQAARFDDFWAAYPNRKGKAEALKKWRALSLDAIADRIIADVKARIACDREWISGYVPHGSTYVNGRGWEDEIAAVRNPRGIAAAGVFGVAL